MEGAEYYFENTFDITTWLFNKYGWEKLKGSNISMDNLYTSILLANEIMDKNVTMLGTIRANRKGIPNEVKDMERRGENSTIV